MKNNALFAAVILLAVFPCFADTIFFVNSPPPIPSSGNNPVSLGPIETLDLGVEPPERVTGGTFSSSTPGVVFTANPDGTANVTIIPSEYKPQTQYLENDGLPDITVCYTKDGATLKCLVFVEVGTIGSVFSAADNDQVDTAGNRARTPIPTEDNGSDNDTAGDDGDPVSTATREFFFYQRLLDLNAPTIPLTFDLYHGSLLFDLTSFKHLPGDFAHNHSVTARKLDLGVAFFQLHFDLGLGQRVSFAGINDGNWTLTNGHRWQYTVEETTGYYYLRHPGTHRVWIFKKMPNGSPTIEPARCLRIVDRNQNALSYTYGANPEISGPDSVTDSLGRSLTFTYARATDAAADLRLYLTSVSDHTGRSVHFSPREAGGRVRFDSLTDARGGIYNFSYDANSFLTSRSMPKGNTPYTVTFDTIPNLNFEGTLGVVTSRTDSFGRTTTFAEEDGLPGLGEKRVVVTNPDGTQAHHLHSESNGLSGMIDECGHAMVFAVDSASDSFTSYTDRDGGQGTYSYHPSGHLATRTDPRSNPTTFTYTDSAPQTFTNPEFAESVQFSFPDLTRVDHADGTFRLFTYDGAGNRLTSTDRAGHSLTATFNTRGQILTFSNDLGGTTTTTYDPATALPATITTTETGTTTLTYDALSRLTTVTRPDSTTVTYAYDALGRPTSITDEENVVTAYTYDPNSNLTAITAAQGSPEERSYTFAYDSLDRMIFTTDPASAQTGVEHGYHDQPTRLNLPDGASLQLTYDERRELVSMVDEAGNPFTYSRLPSTLLRSVTTPAGRRQSYQRDPLGVITAITDASGDTLAIQRDVFSRPTTLTDALQRITTLVRDGEGRVTTRTEPTVGTTTYTYDANGRLTSLTDPRNNDWDFAYSPLGRLTGIEDPDTRSESRTYDTRGRLDTITHPDGITETWTYHPDSQPAARTFSDGLTHSFTYDALNRLTNSTRTLAGRTDTVAYTYDNRSRFASTTVNGNATTATYDSRQRLASLTYPGGMTVGYTYDPRGLVTQVCDSLTGAAIVFEYSDDRQLTKATRSNGRVTTYTYDAEGLLASITHDTGATVTANYTPADELASLTRTGFPTDGSSALAAKTDTFTFNASSEITNTGLTYDDRGRPENVGWDSDNRLVSLPGAAPVSLHYTALGDLTARTEGATTTEYLYSAALRDKPIIGEKFGGRFTRFYVTLPDGSVAYHIDNPDTNPVPRFHHHGQTGNTRFLTSGDGAVTDSYAYDAYGNLLARTGSSTQFYTYNGRYGVRFEPAANLLHMRHRYYDPAAARFLSRDPIYHSLITRSGLDTNPYHFTKGQPTHRTDPSGLDFGAFADLISHEVRKSVDQKIENLFSIKAHSEDQDSESLDAARVELFDQLLQGVRDWGKLLGELIAAQHLVEVQRKADRKAFNAAHGKNGGFGNFRQLAIMQALTDDSPDTSTDQTLRRASLLGHFEITTEDLAANAARYGVDPDQYRDPDIVEFEREAARLPWHKN